MTAVSSIKENSSFVELEGARILIVDDSEMIIESIKANLSACGAQCMSASTIAEAMGCLENKQVDAAIVDMVLPDGSGMKIIKHFESTNMRIPVVIITGFADRALALMAENAGIGAVITKPFSRSQLRFTLCKEIIRHRSVTEGTETDEFNNPGNGVELTGQSTYMQALKNKITNFAQSNVPILIHGPTGTGKEIVARAIHELSSRSKNAMIVINSSAIPEHLEESEFFGHSKGAFTGALEEKDGILRCADGSTLFLDEVAEFSLRLQAKLLRALDGHEFSRVGETKPRSSDFRLISATNRSLKDMIAAGTFREDLYYRLSAGIIETKALVEHREDIPSLVRHFMNDFGERHKKVFSIDQESLAMLMEHVWPGNIRELRNTITMLCTSAMKGRRINKGMVVQIVPNLQDVKPVPASFTAIKKDFEKSYYGKLISKHGGNISRASKEAGLLRPNLSKKLKDLGIIANDYKTEKRP
jgi:DNA-binding NtrC family response regulator